MNNEIINAVKRLERAGSENSRATQKLKDACKQLGEFIEKQVPHNVRLPRNYIVKETSNSYYLVKIKNAFAYGEEVEYFGNTITDPYKEPSRLLCLQFAKDIAEGLLDEIAEFLEKRKEESEEAEKILIAKID